MPWPVAIGHRRSYGWVNSPPAPISILADAVATTMNCGLDGYDHSALFLMSSLGRWIMELVGFPAEGSLCLLLTGGSAATLNALTAARHRAAERAGWNLRAEGLQGGRARLVALHERGKPFLDPEVRRAARHRHGQPARRSRRTMRFPHAARRAAPRDRSRPDGGPPAVRDRRLRRRDQHRRHRPAGRDRRHRGRVRHLAARGRRVRRLGGARSRLRGPLPGASRAPTRSRSIRTSGRRCRSTAARC